MCEGLSLSLSCVHERVEARYFPGLPQVVGRTLAQSAGLPWSHRPSPYSGSLSPRCLHHVCLWAGVGGSCPLCRTQSVSPVPFFPFSLLPLHLSPQTPLPTPPSSPPPSSLPLLLSHSLNNIKVKQADSTFAFLGEGGAVTENTVFWKDCNAWNNDIWTGRHVAVIPALGGEEGVSGVWGLCELRLTWSRKQGFKQANRWTLSVHLGWFLLS